MKMKISLYLSPELVIQVHFGREDETLLAPQGTSNASSREIYPKLYANSITAINTGENHSLSLGMRELPTDVLEITYLCNLS